MTKFLRKIIVSIAMIFQIQENITKIRTLYYKIIFKSFWKHSWVFWHILVASSWNIQLWDYSYINVWVSLVAASKIIIWDHCHISAYSKLYTVGLDLSEKDYKKRKHISKDIIIHDGVWVWLWSIILMWVEIGEGAVVAAGSVVTKNIPPFELWGWVPARKIKSLN